MKFLSCVRTIFLQLSSTWNFPSTRVNHLIAPKPCNIPSSLSSFISLPLDSSFSTADIVSRYFFFRFRPTFLTSWRNKHSSSWRFCRLNSTFKSRSSLSVTPWDMKRFLRCSNSLCTDRPTKNNSVNVTILAYD